MTAANEIIEKAEKHLIHTYNRYPIVLDRGEGMYLYDVEGKRYLDFGSGIGVFALGYGNPEYNQAVKSQVDKLIHTSNYFYNAPAAEAGEKLANAAGMAKVFFTNSGAEAVEGALKLAKKYAKIKKGASASGVIAMEHSFHGRSIGAVSVTGTARYREPFEPLMPDVSFARYNDPDSVEQLIGENTCAVILETIQGEGGVYPAEAKFLQTVRKLCDRYDALLICDEIQCGMGRSGSMFAYQKYGICPDVVTSAKALGCGVPIGAFMASSKVSEVLCAGDHGTTYGGNPLACAAACAVFDLFKKNNILENADRVGAYLYQRLEEVKNRHQDIIAHRGMGLMQGLEFNRPVAETIQKLLEKGCIMFSAGTNVLRFLPPLILQEAHVDEMTDRLETCLS